jgi:hypothetical protein
MVLRRGPKPTTPRGSTNAPPEPIRHFIPSSNQLIREFATARQTTGTIARLARPARIALRAILPTSPAASQELPPPSRDRSATARLKTTTGYRRATTSSAKKWGWARMMNERARSGANRQRLSAGTNDAMDRMSAQITRSHLIFSQ